MRVAVVGHVEWVRVRPRATRVPRPGEIVHAIETWEEPAGGGAVAAAQLARLAASCLFFTALGADELGRRLARRAENAGVEVTGDPRHRAHAACFHLRRRHRRADDHRARREAPVPTAADTGCPGRSWPAGRRLFVSGDAEALHCAVRRASSSRPRGSFATLRRQASNSMHSSASGEDEASSTARATSTLRRTVAVTTAGGLGGWLQPGGPFRPAPLPGRSSTRTAAGDCFAAGLPRARAWGCHRRRCRSCRPLRGGGHDRPWALLRANRPGSAGSLTTRKIPLPGWTGGGWWFIVGRSGNLPTAPGCFSAHTTTPSMTKTVSLFRPSSGSLPGRCRRHARPRRLPVRLPSSGLGSTRRRPTAHAGSAQPGRPADPALLLRRSVRGRARQAGPRDDSRRRCSSTRSWAGKSSSPVSTTTSRSGTAPPGARSWPKSKGVRRMLPNVLQTSATDHVPVLAEEVRELLAVQPGETVVDATFGAGGHAALLAADLRGTGKLIAIDRDPRVRAVLRAVPKQRAGVQTRFLRGDFSRRARASSPATACGADAILLDLGVSSMQIDRPERGFSYAADAPLDMRMDPSARRHGRGDRQRGRGARPGARSSAATARSATRGRSRARSCAAGASSRSSGRASSSRRSSAAIPAPARFGDGPSRQARLPGAAHRRQRRARGARGARCRRRSTMLRPGGRLAVISFHSLEDRIVKRFMRDRERGCDCPPDFPVCVCGNEPELPLDIAQARSARAPREIAANPRSSSGALRVAVKVLAHSATPGTLARRAQHPGSRATAGARCRQAVHEALRGAAPLAAPSAAARRHRLPGRRRLDRGRGGAARRCRRDQRRRSAPEHAARQPRPGARRSAR